MLFDIVFYGFISKLEIYDLPSRFYPRYDSVGKDWDVFFSCFLYFICPYLQMFINFLGSFEIEIWGYNVF